MCKNVWKEYETNSQLEHNDQPTDGRTWGVIGKLNFQLYSLTFNQETESFILNKAEKLDLINNLLPYF